jgi:acetyl-CoA C-acetyltransferase
MGIPHTVPAFTVNQACASGLQSIALAAQAIRLEEAEVVLAGGMENMSRVPFLLDGLRQGYRLGDSQVVDAMIRDGFLCPLCNQVMGQTAETLASEYGISREEQDRFAAGSQQRCERARQEGAFRNEIVSLNIDGQTLAEDETPRDGVTPESLAKLPPVFRSGGTVHAGNSCGITDGAAAVVVTSLDRARKLGRAPMAKILGSAEAGVDPARMGIGPVLSTRKLLERLRLSLDEFDLVEINEAFAAQVLACVRDLKLDLARTNIHGGAIALGHPIGCSGARIVVTLLHALRRKGGRRGLATLCVSGGMGMSMAFEA